MGRSGESGIPRSASFAPPPWVAQANRGYPDPLPSLLDLEELGLLVLQEVVDLGDHLVGALLELFLGAVEIVLAELAVLFEPFELVAGLATDVAHRDPRFLGLGAHDLHQLP